MGQFIFTIFVVQACEFHKVDCCFDLIVFTLFHHSAPDTISAEIPSHIKERQDALYNDSLIVKDMHPYMPLNDHKYCALYASKLPLNSPISPPLI
jgi:hypothetical protein